MAANKLLLEKGGIILAPEYAKENLNTLVLKKSTNVLLEYQDFTMKNQVARAFLPVPACSSLPLIPIWNMQAGLLQQLCKRDRVTEAGPPWFHSAAGRT